MKHKYLQRLGMVTVMMAAVLTAGCFGPKKVAVTEATQRDLPVRISSDANVTALNKATIEPATSGQVATLAVKVGDDVKQGQVVATLDTSSLQEQLNTLLTKIKEQATATVHAAPQTTTVVPGAVSQADVERAREMMANGIITEKEYATIASRAQTTTVTSGGGYVTTPGADTSSLQAAIAQVQAQIAQAQIVAPINGKVTAIYNEDRKVAIAGKPFMMIQETSPVVATLTIPQGFAMALASPEGKASVKVRLKVDDKELPGEITYINTNAPAGSPGVLLKATFQNTDNIIKPGEFYTLVIESDVKASVLTLPEKAIHEGKDGKYVYVVTADDTVDVRVVETGEKADGFIVIMNGLSAGEKVITSKGSFQLGEKITIQ
ncbi:efflux RND transporter periplasmic adaptor subunit [Veillonella magna]|uniref:Efflux RND transporter periplasmic adaptor subunit n=1 Tax=Veillonella magna TaxID=464322 RepID=A0ABS2GHR8_9FIRM|nr:efflux RND transporter periplasmic adaptor subunit [Veillonella magna]MBD8976430.1 efflux RND transporter periplasmic adaptor subunit [Veillonella magna]MBM6825297.1 efflux RND transporter periplasmic adaptor subunit [Veillonella magna]MBM6913591.1 efflux RND transporter periplasmic adaptor subunit [Veillonella magna]